MSRAGKPGQHDPEAFLQRWSRRKSAARDRSAPPDNTAADTDPTPVGESATPPAQERQPVLTDADMPPLETLDAGSDFAPFLSPAVSDGLRQKALRILFRQPACNIVDGLNDYDEDYTQFPGLGSVVTHEMKHMLKRELKAETSGQTDAADRQQEARSAGTGLAASEPVDRTTGPSRAAVTGQPGQDADDEAGKV